MFIWHWLLNVTGVHFNNGASQWYNFWSGFGSDLGEATIIVAIIGWYKHNECHEDTCHRLAKYPFRHYKLCKKHHPEVPDKVTHLHIKKLHEASQDRYET